MPEILGLHSDAVKADISKCLPATVTAVNAAAQTVDVQIAINEILHDDLGNTYVLPAPSISGVPLGVMRGGGFLVWVPVAVGDSVLLIFSDLSADSWRAGDGHPQPPGWVGRHTKDSPWALPCCAPDSKALTSPPGDAGKLIIGKDGGAAQIKISATDIELGASATDAVALASKVDAFIQTVMSWLPAAGDGGAALKTALTTAGFTITSTVKSNLVKSG